MTKLKVGLFFGGRSTEHEVSVVSALQAYENFDLEKYEVIPFYVSKEGAVYTNPKFLEIKNFKDVDSLLLASREVIFIKGGLKTSGLFSETILIDAAVLLFHGSFGEDGCIQGVFETYQIPYTGLNVMGSAVAMDKVISKYIFQSLGFNVGKFVCINRNDWIENPDKFLAGLKTLQFPVFVKPADIGSTIGINKAKDIDELKFNIEIAAVYSDKILIEESYEGCIEVNCAALGYKEITPSVCEMPIRTGEALSFDDKYLKGGKGKGGKGAGMASLSRQIPAPINPKLAKEIQETTVKIFKTLEGCGVARIDYFVDLKREKFWVNEVNSPPGSMAFYLYEPLGIKYKELLDRVITDALERFKDQQKTQYVFHSGLLSQMASSSGIKS